jgi:hypothetical protein
MAETDPLSQVMDSIWTMLEGRKDFVDLVPPGNRIKSPPAYRDPEKEGHDPADYPEVRIIPIGISAKPYATSSSSQLTLRIEIQISAGDQRWQPKFFPVVWSIYRAMLDWVMVLTALTWNSQPFVTVCQTEEASIGQSVTELAKNVKGWSAVWAGSVLLTFQSSALKEV